MSSNKFIGKIVKVRQYNDEYCEYYGFLKYDQGGRCTLEDSYVVMKTMEGDVMGKEFMPREHELYRVRYTELCSAEDLKRLKEINELNVFKWLDYWQEGDDLPAMKTIETTMTIPLSCTEVQEGECIRMDRETIEHFKSKEEGSREG